MSDEKAAPLTAGELMQMALSGESVPADRILATFADPSNWVQIYNGTSSRDDYQALPCEWAFIGPVRPAYELAQLYEKTRDVGRIPDELTRSEKIKGGWEEGRSNELPAKWESYP